MRRLSCLAAVIAAVSITALTAASAMAVPREFYGIAGEGFHPKSEVDRMGEANVGTLRFLIGWPSVEPSDDQFDFTKIDRHVGDLAAAGIRPLPFVWGTPAFVSSNTLEMPVGSQADKSQWQQLLRTLVDRYGPGGTYWTTVYPTDHPGEQPMPITTWQIWNEENGEKHASNPSPAQYAELLKISHPAITGEDPNAQIVLGGMVEAKSNRGERIPASKFLKKMYKTGGVENFFDAVAIHPYSPDLEGIEDQIGNVRKVLKKNDRSAGVWVSEMGWGSKNKGKLGVGKKQQAKLLKGSFKLLKRNRGKWKIDGVIWYTWRDDPAANCDWCTTAGLLKQNGTKAKPSFKAYLKFTHGS
jgi:polysaccharide biosynthesis protein PslG